MDTDHYNVLKEIKTAIKDYEIVTGIKCYLINTRGKRVGDRNCYQRNTVCEYIQKFDHQGECIRDYLYRCLPTLDTEEACIYRCHYGMLNIAMPIMPDTDTVYFVSSGPFLKEPPNRHLIGNLTKKNSSLCGHDHYLYELLQTVPVLTNEQWQALSNTLQRTILPIVDNNLDRFKKNNNIARVFTYNLRRLSIRSQFRQEALILQKELEILVRNCKSDCITYYIDSLDLLLGESLKTVFKGHIFEVTKSKATSYLLALWNTANNTDLDMELIFDEKYKLIRNFLLINDRLSLNTMVLYITDRFKWMAIYGNANKNNRVILGAIECIYTNHGNVSMGEVAKYVSLSPSYFSTLFKKEMGRNYTEYLNKIKIEISKLLLYEDNSLTEIAHKLGFTDQSHYINVFKRYEYTSPSRWKSANF